MTGSDEIEGTQANTLDPALLASAFAFVSRFAESNPDKVSEAFIELKDGGLIGVGPFSIARVISPKLRGQSLQVGYKQEKALSSALSCMSEGIILSRTKKFQILTSGDFMFGFAGVNSGAAAYGEQLGDRVKFGDSIVVAREDFANQLLAHRPIIETGESVIIDIRITPQANDGLVTLTSRSPIPASQGKQRKVTTRLPVGLRGSADYRVHLRLRYEDLKMVVMPSKAVDPLAAPNLSFVPRQLLNGGGTALVFSAGEEDEARHEDVLLLDQGVTE